MTFFLFKKGVICAFSPFESHYVATFHYRSTVQRKLHSKLQVKKCFTAALVTIQVTNREYCSTILCNIACTVHVVYRFVALQNVVI